MYICLCHGITDKQIRKLLTQTDKHQLSHVRDELGVASQCGKCAKAANAIVQDYASSVGVTLCATTEQESSSKSTNQPTFYNAA